MNRRDFLRRSLYLGLALGLPVGVVVAECGPHTPAPVGHRGIVCPKCGGVHASPGREALRERARIELACWYQQEIDRLTAKALTE